MARRIPPDERVQRRRRHAAAQARLRSRRRRQVELYSLEAGRQERLLAERFGGLKPGTQDKAAISVALGKLLRRAIVSLLREQGRVE